MVVMGRRRSRREKIKEDFSKGYSKEGREGGEGG